LNELTLVNARPDLDKLSGFPGKSSPLATIDYFDDSYTVDSQFLIRYWQRV
jgi:hypothetical protein